MWFGDCTENKRLLQVKLVSTDDDAKINESFAYSWLVTHETFIILYFGNYSLGCIYS